MASLPGAPGPDGQPQPVDLDGVMSRIAALAPLHHTPPPPRPMRIVRDAAGRVSHLEPMS
jgi:hypothetical protein